MSNEESAERRREQSGAAEEEPQQQPGASTGGPEAAEPEREDAADSGTEAEAGVDAETAHAGAPPPGQAEDPETEIARLREELEAARAEADDYWNRLVRSEAEKENVRKRAEKDIESARKQSLEKLAGELLSVRDSLEMGVDAAQQEDADPAKIREGSELTLRMLTQAMEKFGIEEINPEGEKFNPDLHQAMSMQEVEGREPNTVISVMQKGYRIGDRLLRPALVMVAK